MSFKDIQRYSNYPTELTECSILPTHGLGASTFFICLDPLILDLSDRDDCYMKTEVIATNRPHDLDSVDASEKERHCNSLEPWNVKRCSGW